MLYYNISTSSRRPGRSGTFGFAPWAHISVGFGSSLRIVVVAAFAGLAILALSATLRLLVLGLQLRSFPFFDAERRRIVRLAPVNQLLTKGLPETPSLGIGCRRLKS